MPNTARKQQFWTKSQLAVREFGRSRTRPQERKDCIMFLELARQRNKTDHFPIFQHPLRSQIEGWKFSLSILTSGAQEHTNTDCVLVEKTTTFTTMLKDLLLNTELAIDAEMSLHHQGYHGNYLCVLQISTPKVDYIIDTLKMAGEMHQLKQVLQNPAILKIFHGGDNDILALQADYKMFVVGVLDMQIVYQHLFNQERPKFEKLVHAFLKEEIKVNKSAQCADWTLRPIPTKMMQYARDDSRLLMKSWIAAKPLIIHKLKENPLLLDSVTRDCRKIALLLKKLKPQKYIQDCTRKAQPEERELIAAVASYILNSARVNDRKPTDIISPSELIQSLSTRNLAKIRTNIYVAPADKLAIEKCINEE